jgi:hypothetical protein
MTCEDGDRRTSLFNTLYILCFYINKFDNTPTYTPSQDYRSFCGWSDGRSPGS